MQIALAFASGMRYGGGTGRAVVSGSRSRWRPLPLLRGGPPVLLIGVVMDDAGARRRLFGVSGLFPLSVRPYFVRHFQVGVLFFFWRWDNVTEIDWFEVGFKRADCGISH